MKPRDKKIMVIVLPILVGLFLYFILVPLVYILAGLTAYYIIFLVLPLFREIERKDDMKRAWEYVCKWWWDFRKEDITSLLGRGFERYFGDDKFIAFVVNRGKLGARKLMPLVVVVNTKGPEVVYWDDNPTSEEIENPFIKISPVLVGTPSPSIKPELEPALRGRKIEKVEKEKIKEIEEEGEEVGE